MVCGLWQCEALRASQKGGWEFSRRELRSSLQRGLNGGAMASQITSLTIVYSIVYSGADQRKHQSSASPAFVRGNHRGPVNSPHKWPVTRNMFPLDDVIMWSTHWMSSWQYDTNTSTSWRMDYWSTSWIVLNKDSLNLAIISSYYFKMQGVTFIPNIEKRIRLTLIINNG